MKVLLAITAALLANVPVAAAVAGGSYSGNWPLTVSRSLGSNGSYCLTLTDDGSLGWPHSGWASLASQGGLYGTFQLIGHTLVATIEESGEGQNAGLVFGAHAANGKIGQGTFEVVYGGQETDSGKVAFGAKGGC